MAVALAFGPFAFPDFEAAGLQYARTKLNAHHRIGGLLIDRCTQGYGTAPMSIGMAFGFCTACACTCRKTRRRLLRSSRRALRRPHSSDREVTKQIFRDVDEDKTGFIDRKDLPKAVAALEEAWGVKFDPTSVQEIFYAFADVNREKWLGEAGLRLGRRFRASLLESFDKMDVDGTGVIGLAEFSKAFGFVKSRHRFTVSLDDNDISSVFSKFDVDGDGLVSRSEYLAVGVSAHNKATDTLLNELFDQVDADGNGILTAQEVKAALKTLDFSPDFKTDEVAAAMVRIFRSVSLAEWLKGACVLKEIQCGPRINLIRPGAFQGFAGISKEFLAGLTVAFVALPKAIAYGSASGLGAASGLYCSIFLGIAAALFGGTSTLISGPAPPLVLPVAALVLNFRDPCLVAATIVLSGLFQIVFGMLRLGSAMRFVPAIVISAFMTGVGSLIIALQTPILLGYKAQGGAIASLCALPTLITQANPAAMAIGLGTIAVLYKFPDAAIGSFKIPRPLMALVLSSVAAATIVPALGLSVPLLGAIPRGLPHLIMPTLTLRSLPIVVKGAAVLAFIGMIDTLLTSLIADNLTSTFHDSNRELVGQGIGNALSGMFGGIPGSGNTTPTLVNIRAGSRSPVSGMIQGLTILGIILGLGPLAAYLPMPALAGILIQSGLGVIDWRTLSKLFRRHLTLEDLIVFSVTLVGTIFYDLIMAVVAGSTVAAWVFVVKMSRLQFSTYRPEIVEIEDGLICRLRGPLTFAVASPLLRMLLPQLVGKTRVQLDLHSVRLVGSAAVVALEQIADKVVEHGGTLLVYGLRKSVNGHRLLAHSRLAQLACNETVYDKRDSIEASS
eukprot:TRINITY_DN26785_c0_g1_i1.p1 TRINITY_DN26785_c0_g1~~TRINITY_DN26785_c0_g1_i1.p1  ORF type:complete len:841 (-),score=84.92 TRINITY_DN26785_c0_g1_i1:26-2548(-)